MIILQATKGHQTESIGGPTEKQYERYKRKYEKQGWKVEKI